MPTNVPPLWLAGAVGGRRWLAPGWLAPGWLAPAARGLLAGGGRGELAVVPVPAQCLAHDELVALRVARRAERGTVVGHGDRRGAARLDRHEVERGEPVRRRQVPVGRP